MHELTNGFRLCLPEVGARARLPTSADPGCRAEVNSFLEDPAKYLDTAKTAGDHTARTNLEAVADCLGTSRCQSFDDCITLSRQQFEVRHHPKAGGLYQRMYPMACSL